jgi:hypothetical protein
LEGAEEDEADGEEEEGALVSETYWEACFSWGLNLSTSCLMILPPGPDPFPYKSDNEIPFSFAAVLAAGLATTLPYFF